jgi:hypothetical protein
VIISRACNPNRPGSRPSPHRQPAVIALILVATAITACTPAVSPTRAPLPTFSGAVDARPALPITAQPAESALMPIASAAAPSALPSSESDRLPLEQPFGADTLAIAFYTDSGGRPCLRYTINARRDFLPVSNCATSARATLVAVQGIEADAQGAVYSIIAGRALDERITAVSIEFADGDNTPAEVKDTGDSAGFIVVLPGEHVALRAIPIDQYGNLVGDKYTFR